MRLELQVWFSAPWRATEVFASPAQSHTLDRCGDTGSLEFSPNDRMGANKTDLFIGNERCHVLMGRILIANPHCMTLNIIFGTKV